MANVLVNEQSLSDIAAAIRAKLGVQTTWKPGQMASAIGSIPVPGGESFPLDCTIFSVSRESSMRINLTGEQIETVWSGGSSIGAMLVFAYAIPSSVKSVTYLVSTGSSYSVTNERFLLTVGLTATRPSGLIDADAAFLAANKHNVRNQAETAITLDCSAVTQNGYLIVVAHGWNAVLRSVTLHY